MEILVGALATVLSATVLGIGTLLVRTMVRGLKTYLDDEIRSKLVPNGGSSIADRLTALEERMNKLTDIFEDNGCANPGCPRRFACEHTPQERRKSLFRG